MMAMNGTTREAKLAIRFTPPMIMTPTSTADTAALSHTLIPHALRMASATPFA